MPVVSSDLPCVRCGYNLRTQPLDGRCPECGTPVAASLPPAGFRYRTAAAAVRARRGLALFAIAALAGSLGYLYYWVALRLSLSVPPAVFRLASQACGLLSAGIAVTVTLGIVWIALPYGRRGDRSFQSLGVVTLILAALGAAPIVYDVYAQVTRELLYSRSSAWTATYGALRLAAHTSYVLAWVILLLRVRRRRETSLWFCSVLVVVLHTIALAAAIWTLVYFLRHTTFSGGFVVTVEDADPSALLRWYNKWAFHIGQGGSILTLLGIWLYWRKLNRALAVRPGRVAARGDHQAATVRHAGRFSDGPGAKGP